MPLDIDEQEHDEIIRCRSCDRGLTQGMDAIRLQSGVLGPRGLVPLSDPEYFCSRTCLEQHCDDTWEEASRIEHEEHDEKE